MYHATKAQARTSIYNEQMSDSCANISCIYSVIIPEIVTLNATPILKRWYNIFLHFALQSLNIFQKTLFRKLAQKLRSKITNRKFFRCLEIHRRLPASRAPKTDTFLIDIFRDIFLKSTKQCAPINKILISLRGIISSLNQIRMVWDKCKR